MHSVNFSFNLKLSIQKHKYSLPHFPSNQTNIKADTTDTERERERERERLKHKSYQTCKSWMKQRLSKFFIEILKYIEQDAILVFQNHFLEKQTDCKGRERVVTWWTRKERSDWTSRRGRAIHLLLLLLLPLPYTDPLLSLKIWDPSSYPRVSRTFHHYFIVEVWDAVAASSRHGDWAMVWESFWILGRERSEEGESFLFVWVAERQREELTFTANPGWTC